MMDGRVIVSALGTILLFGVSAEARRLAQCVARALAPYSRDRAAAMMGTTIADLDAQLTGRAPLSEHAIARQRPTRPPARTHGNGSWGIAERFGCQRYGRTVTHAVTRVGQTFILRGVQMAGQTDYRIRFVMDPDAQFEESNGEARPLTREEYAGNEYMRDGQIVTYKDYLAYYGDPDRHVYLMSTVEKRCPCCKRWEPAGGTGSIDFMDDDHELRAMDQWFTVADIDKIPGYLREMALSDFDEAGADLPSDLRCATDGCSFFHVAGSKHCGQHGGGK